jgi:hypothetical protein
MTECYDCGGDGPLKAWDLGEDHGFWVGVRHVQLCDECWHKRDNYDGPAEPDYDTKTLAEQCREAWDIKHGIRS